MRSVLSQSGKPIYIAASVNEVKELVQDLIKEDVIAYDTETTGLSSHDDHILLVSLSSRTKDYVIDFQIVGLQNFYLLKPLLENEKILKLGHNWSYDWKMTFANNIRVNNVYDTMIAEQVLTAGVYLPMVAVAEGRKKATSNSLEAVAYRRCGAVLDKEMQSSFIGHDGTTSFTDRQYVYAAEDAQYLYPIWEQQLEEIKKWDLGRVIDLEMRLVPATSLMEHQGMPINIEALEELREPFLKYVNVTYKALQDAFIEAGAAKRILFEKVDGYGRYTAVNPNSKPQNKPDKTTGEKVYKEGQMARALKYLGINVHSLAAKEIIKWDFRYSKRKEALAAVRFSDLVDDSEIAEALERYGGLENPYLRLYMFYQGAEKLYGTFIKGTLDKVDRKRRRLFGWFRQCGARATGRFSSNLQQFPKDGKLKHLGLGQYSIRQCFEAPKGRKLIIADYSAIELVILADRSKDERLAYEHMQGDLHTLVAKATLGKILPIALELCKDNKDQEPYKTIRDATKVISYGICYGVTGKSLAEQMNSALGHLGVKLTPDQGDDFVRIWRTEMFPQAGKFLEQCSIQAVSKGYTESTLGRKRFYDLAEIATNVWKERAAMREGCNQSIQSTSADMTKLAMVYLYETLDIKRCRLIASVHDELVLEATDQYAEEAARILKECMERSAKEVLEFLGDKVIVKPAIRERYDK